MSLSGSTIVFEREAHVASDVVTLDDVADLSALPSTLLDRARSVRIATFTGTSDRLTLSSRRISERARAQIPALAAWFPRADQTMVIVGRRPVPVRARLSPERSCARLVSTLEAGATPLAADFSSAPCGETALDNAFRYDAGCRVLRTQARLDAGALVVAPPPNLLAALRIGEPLVVAVRIGPVVVERDASVAAPARADERMFVRTSDNQVFAVPQPGRTP
jgi:hypothetical protein